METILILDLFLPVITLTCTPSTEGMYNIDALTGGEMSVLYRTDKNYEQTLDFYGATTLP